MSVRILLVGAGWWATAHHLPALEAHPDAVVAAVCDPVAERAAAVADRTGAAVHPTLAGALDAGDYDAALIATPSAAHHGAAAATLDAGLHTLVEKPLTLTAASAADLLARARRASVHLTVGNTYQHAPAALLARRAVREDIGRLLQVTVEFGSRAGELYAAAERGEAATARGQHPAAYTAANGGGQAHTQLTHALGMLCWVTGRQVTTVAAFTEHHGLAVDVDDVAALRLEGGATAVAVSTGAVPEPLPLRQHLRYQGTDGVVEQDLYRARTVLHRPDGSHVVREPGQHEAAYDAAAPARAFVDLVLGRGDNLGGATEAAAAVAATEALLRAARTGAVVGVEPLPAADVPGACPGAGGPAGEAP
ncbi:Gfo/Idh/MocA family oxidoreductase [Georgenia daeguensis]|uniref:Gfo/Idh/MocA family oxidoreductase n=1 Tax=Georgenia daeguensis TaxID=908355 RepID=A0ABP8EYR5_9MICO